MNASMQPDNIIQATPSRERGNPLKIAFLAQNRFHISPLQLQNDAQNANFGLQSHLKMKLNPRRMLFRQMMTPKGSELIKNLTTVHENGGAREMWCFSIFLIFST